LSGRNIARAVLALAVLAGVLAMHSLGSSMDSMAVMSPHLSPETSMSASMTPPVAAGADVGTRVSAATGARQSICGQEHCVATLRPTAQLRAQVLPAAESEAAPSSGRTAATQRHLMLRAPLPSTSLTVLCVSRT
jgi:hypothetical protein